MFDTKNIKDQKVARFLGDMALISRMNMSPDSVKLLPEKKRAEYLWYMYCEDRKAEQKRVEVELRRRG
jgi:hypothetical protein